MVTSRSEISSLTSPVTSSARRSRPSPVRMTGGQVEVAGAGDGQVAARHQTQDGQLEEALDRKLGIDAGTRHDSIVADGSMQLDA